MNNGTLIVYSGPSGVGKGTILKPYLETHPEAVLSISVTTRAPREGETNGVEYYFVSRGEFERLIKGGGMLEYAQYSGNYYGTPRAAVERMIAEGRDVVLEIEVQGAMQVKKTFPDAVFVFILPPSYESLRERLTGRGTETPETLAKRLATARHELACAPEYDFVIVNDDINQAIERLTTVIQAAKYRTGNMKNMIEKVCEEE